MHVLSVQYKRKTIPLYDISIGGVFKCVASINMCTKKAVQLNGRSFKKTVIHQCGWVYSTDIRETKEKELRIKDD